MPQAKLVIFEGIDGSGKTTQLGLAKAFLESKGLSVYTTRNLGGTPIGEELRKTVISPLSRPAMTDFYISLAIQEALLPEIANAKENHDFILMDRASLSLVAYQCFGSGVDKEHGWQQSDKAIDELNPDLILIFDADIATSLQRARQASHKADYFENKENEFFERVKQGYTEAADRYDTTIIDANRSIEEVQQDTLAQIDKLI